MATPNWFDVTTFGADPTGSGDSTAAIQSAVNACVAAAGGTIYVPHGRFKVSGSININGANGPVLAGDGAYNTTLFSTTSNIDVLVASGNAVEIRNLTLTSTPAQTGGALIYGNKTANITLLGVNFSNYNVGFYSQDNLVTVRDCTFSGGIPGRGIGIFVDGGAGGGVIDNVVMTPPGRNSQPYAGIEVVQAGAVLISNSNIIQQGTDLYINPGANQGAFAIFAVNTYFDSAVSGLIIQPSGGGGVQRVLFSNCWFSSHTSGGGGVVIENGGGGATSSVSFENCIAIQNSGSGISINDGSDITVRGGIFGGNVYGIYVGPNVSDFSVEGVSAGAYSTVGNSQYGIVVSGGSTDHYIVANNRVRGNAVGGVYDAGTGANKFVGNNIG